MPEPDTLLKLADQCVKCGYCLPVCPTFRLERTEAESPRGRIALIQGWLTQDIPPSPILFRHLDQCLACRACEAACPSLVRYGSLMDGARTLRQARALWWRRWPRQTVLTLLSQPRWLALLAPFGQFARWISQKRPFQARRPRLALVLRLGSALHAPRQPRAVSRTHHTSPFPAAPYPAGPATPTPADKRLGLFVGCVARGTQGPTIDAARQLLALLSIPYQEPPTQGCCGALLRHQGFATAADCQLARNAQAFSGMTLVGFSSACVLELQTSEVLTAREICEYLATAPALAQAAPRPLAARVLVHEPCSQRLLPGGASAVYRLLGRIPELTVAPLPGNDSCCGAAGTYLLEHPHTALALLEPKLEVLRDLRPDYLVTTNSGCALHLAAGLAAAGLDIPVLHPIELLEQQLRPNTHCHQQEHPRH